MIARRCHTQAHLGRAYRRAERRVMRRFHNAQSRYDLYHEAEVLSARIAAQIASDLRPHWSLAYGADATLAHRAARVALGLVR